MSTVPVKRLTEQEYLTRERKAPFKSEFYRGEMFAMAGATREHNVIATNISRGLGNQLTGKRCDVYQSDMKVRVAATGRFTYPDVVVACQPRQFADEQKDVLLNPTLLVEVLSDSTAGYDRGEKATDYRELPSLHEFLLVSQDQALVEHYIRQTPDTWQITRIVGLESTVELASIGCRLILAEIYAEVEFPPHPRPMLRLAEEEQAE
ncbi:MAG: Uma2 family endonuclease [Pirellulaceae bacterium]|nr:Uma2 family endonuclease [Pirellulaceae bacterium]